MEEIGEFRHGNPLVSELDAYEGEQVMEIINCPLDQYVAHDVQVDARYTFTIHVMRPSWETGNSYVTLAIGYDGWSGYLWEDFTHNSEAWGEYSITLDTAVQTGAVGATELNVEAWTRQGTLVYDGMSLKINPVGITETDGSTFVDEEGPTSDDYTIVLNTQPSASVTITVDPDTQTEVNGNGAGTPMDLTFTTLNWNTEQTVTVKAIDDAVVEGPHTSTITHTAVSTDPDYNGISIDDVVAYVSDNDTDNLLRNPSFEANTVADGSTIEWYQSMGTDGPTDWVHSEGTVGVFNPTGDGTGDFGSAVPDGNNVLMCGDPADNSYSDVWQESIFFPGGVKAGQIINFSAKHAALSSDKGIPYVRMWFFWATTTDPYASGWIKMVDEDRANDDRDWKEFSWSYRVTAVDEAAGYDGISVGLLGWAGGSGPPKSQYDPVFYDDARLTLTFWDPNMPAASNPRPADEEEAVTMGTLLRWKPGESPVYGWATEHQVYFGTDRNVVRDANTSDPEYKATVPEDGDSTVTVDITTVVQNPSFESDVLDDGHWIESEPNSWDTWVMGIVYVWNPLGDGSTQFCSPVPDGDNVVQLGDAGEIYQYVPIPGGLQAGQVYTMSLKHAGLVDGSDPMWMWIDMYASPSSINTWGPHVLGKVERAVDDRDWKEYSVDLDVDALGVAGYDGITPGLWNIGGYDTICDDVRLTATTYTPDNDPNYAPTLQVNTEYFWRIDEVYDKGGGETGVTAGDVWSFTTPYCGQLGQYYKPGDLNRDCYVDFKDFALMALDWLGCTDPANPECDPWSGP